MLSSSSLSECYRCFRTTWDSLSVLLAFHSSITVYPHTFSKDTISQYFKTHQEISHFQLFFADILSLTCCSWEDRRLSCSSFLTALCIYRHSANILTFSPAFTVIVTSTRCFQVLGRFQSWNLANQAVSGLPYYFLVGTFSTKSFPTHLLHSYQL